MTVGFNTELVLSGSPNFGDRRLGKICPRAERPKSTVYTKKLRRPRKTGFRVSGPEIQTLAVDTRTAVWVSTAEKIVLGETRKFSRKFGEV